MKPMLVVTRPKEDAKELAALLKTRGYNCLIEPMLTIKHLPKNKPALKNALKRKPQAIVVTSKHALRLLAPFKISIPVIAVGEATKQEAVSMGFTASDAGGDAELLIRYITRHLEPQHGRLLYLRGENISAGITAKLKKKGFRVDSVITYRAVVSKHFSPRLCKALKGNKAAGVLFFSERTAATYALLAKKHRLLAAHGTMMAFALSKTIASMLKVLPWKSLRVAEKPDTQGIMKLISKRT